MPRLRRWRWPLAGLACVVAAYWGWQHFASSSGTPPQPRAGQQSAQAAPVHAAIVATKPFPVVLNGLGTVQATNTVTVRSRVDGQIEKVAFEEGQMVQEGDLLVQIDPAPFQAALNQATAKLAQDQASLLNAKQDLERTAVLSKQGNATQQLLDQRTRQRRQPDGPGPGRPGRHRERQGPARLHHHQFAADRPRRLSPGGSRQHRARQRSRPAC